MKSGLVARGTAALEGDDFQTGGRELFGDDPAGPAQSHDGDIDRFQFGGHCELRYCARHSKS